MDLLLFFHLFFIFIFLAFNIIRAFYQRKATQTQGEVEYRDSRSLGIARKLIGIPFMLAFLAFFFRPSIFGWASFPLPIWAQWVGVAMGLISLPLIWWVQQAIGSNFSTTLHVRAEHTLVQHGPYRWVRHPMYTVQYINFTALTLLTHNWLIAVFFLGFLTLIVVNRLGKEEATMLEKFGDEYQAYMQRTGRFLPRFLGN